jgi:hypothetical protein
MRFFKSISWHRFSYGFLVVLNVFHQCFVTVEILNLQTLFFQRRPSEAFLYDRMVVLCAQEIQRLGPMDVKIYSLERTTGL